MVKKKKSKKNRKIEKKKKRKLGEVHPKGHCEVFSLFSPPPLLKLPLRLFQCSFYALLALRMKHYEFAEIC
jgi:hypothetical protein